ncbi:serine hydrolase domain-containing protein [Kitasatospora aburaviensis]
MAVVVGVAVGGMTMGVAAPPAAFAAGRPDVVQQGLNALVRDDGMPAALASVVDRDGRTRTYTAGVGDVARGSKVPGDGQVRIGSNTKTFTAVVALQLVGEGRIDLDATVDTYLPGLVRGDGIDGRRITVRQLLQHTSGIPDYEGRLDEAALQYQYFEPRDLLDIALRYKADFAPGDRFAYSNTNYVLAGLIVQKVTGRPVAEEIDRRVVQRIGLRHTYFPAPGTGPSASPTPRLPQGFGRRAPARLHGDGSLRGLGGRADDLHQLRRQPVLHRPPRRPAPPGGPARPDAHHRPHRRHRRRLRPGDHQQAAVVRRVYWGHGGDIPGYETRGGVTDGGRAVNVAVTTVPPDAAATKHVDGVVDAALCR